MVPLWRGKDKAGNALVKNFVVESVVKGGERNTAIRKLRDLLGKRVQRGTAVA